MSSISSEDKIKYCLVTNGASYFETLIAPELERAGLYNWKRVFNGDVKTIQQFKNDALKLQKYDIIHVNLAGGDFGLATKVRGLIGKDAQTKIVTNMDYSVHYFDSSFRTDAAPSTSVFLQDLISSDMVFGVEPKQVSLLKFILNLQKEGMGDKVTLIPHPVDTDRLSVPPPFGLFLPYDNRGDILAYQYHRYDGHWEIARLILSNLPPPQEGGTFLRACLGYTDASFKTEEMPELVMPYISWPKYIYFLSSCSIGMEYRTHSAASRFILEAAALGIPVVSTDYSYLGSEIFPKLSFPMEDFHGMREAIIRLITDKDFRMKQASYGLKKVAEYGFNPSKIKFLKELKKIADSTL